MREWNATTQIAILKHLTDSIDELPSPSSDVELWRVRKDTRTLRCVAVYLSHGVDQVEIRKRVREAQNFFKHADKDHEAVLTTFDPEQTQILMIDSCFAYRRLTNERVPVLTVFEAWAYATWAKDWLQYALGEMKPPAIAAWKARVASMSRMELFLEGVPVAHISATSPLKKS